MEAMTPKQVVDLKISRIPEKILEAFNEAIADNLFEGYATVSQDDVITRILSKMPDIKCQQIFDNNWLDVEPFYRKKGWKVSYDEPGYNESYGASWEFKGK